MFKRLALTGLLSLALLPLAAAQDADAPPTVWYNLDYDRDGVYGMSVDRAYEALEGREPARQVVVAVIDSGVDITHEDLQGQIWTNDDVTGWVAHYADAQSVGTGWTRITATVSPTWSGTLLNANFKLQPTLSDQEFFVDAVALRQVP